MSTTRIKHLLPRPILLIGVSNGIDICWEKVEESMDAKNFFARQQAAVKGKLRQEQLKKLLHE